MTDVTGQALHVGMAMDFATRPETWPVFTAWMAGNLAVCREQAGAEAQEFAEQLRDELGPEYMRIKALRMIQCVCGQPPDAVRLYTLLHGDRVLFHAAVTFAGEAETWPVFLDWLRSEDHRNLAAGLARAGRLVLDGMLGDLHAWAVQPAVAPEPGLDRVARAIEQARGGPAPRLPKGFA